MDFLNQFIPLVLFQSDNIRILADQYFIAHCFDCRAAALITNINFHLITGCMLDLQDIKFFI